MRKILVPIDGSLPSIRALKFVAARQKRENEFEVTALYAQPDVRPNFVFNRDMISEWKVQELDRVVSSPTVKALIKRLNAKIHTELGDAAQIIVGYAKKTRCHEIVMGTRGSGALKGLLIGSVATKVVQLAPVPVTLIK